MVRGADDRAVRDYLRIVKDPAVLLEQPQVQKLQDRLDGSTDPLQRVRLRQQLLDTQAQLRRRQEDAFVAHAKDWARQHAVSPDAFLAEGVPPAVLRRAGIRLSRPRRAAASGRAARVRGIRTRVAAAEIRASVPDGTFTFEDLRERSGASPRPVRRVLRELVEAGAVEQLGPDPAHGGPGPKPMLYRKRGPDDGQATENT